MKNGQLFKLFRSLQTLAKNDKNSRFSYGVAKNMKLILDEVKIIEEVLKPTVEFEAYDKERIELCELHAKKGEDGSAIMSHFPDGKSQYEIEDPEQFQVSLKSLQEEHKTAVEEHDRKVEEYNKLLEEESTIELFKIKVETIPEGISADTILSIFEIIE